MRSSRSARSRGNQSPPAGHGNYRFDHGTARRPRSQCRCCISGLLLAADRVSCPQQAPDVAAAFAAEGEGGGGRGRGQRNSAGASAHLPQDAVCEVGLDASRSLRGVGVTEHVSQLDHAGAVLDRRRGGACGAACAPALPRAPRRVGPPARRHTQPGTGCGRASAACRRSGHTAARPGPRASGRRVARCATGGSGQGPVSSAGSIGIARSLLLCR